MSERRPPTLRGRKDTEIGTRSAETPLKSDLSRMQKAQIRLERYAFSPWYEDDAMLRHKLPAPSFMDREQKKLTTVVCDSQTGNQKLRSVAVPAWRWILTQVT